MTDPTFCGATAFWIAGSCKLPTGHAGKHDPDPYADHPDLPRDEIARRLRERAHDWPNDPDEQIGTHGSPHDAAMTAQIILGDAYMTDETREGLATMLERLEAASIALALAQHRARLMMLPIFTCKACGYQTDRDECGHPDGPSIDGSGRLCPLDFTDGRSAR